MSVTVLGTVRGFKDVQSLNASTLIDVTVLGIVTEVNAAHPANTVLPTIVTPSGHTNLVAFLTSGVT